MSASVNLPLHHKVRKFSFGTGSPGWSRKKGRKTVVVVVVVRNELTIVTLSKHCEGTLHSLQGIAYTEVSRHNSQQSSIDETVSSVIIGR